MRFDKGQLPPVTGFWSLTMHDAQYFFVANPLNRYSISPRQDLKHNPDGSVDLYIQHASPGAEKESNWLPAPKDKFILLCPTVGHRPEPVPRGLALSDSNTSQSGNGNLIDTAQPVGHRTRLIAPRCR